MTGRRERPQERRDPITGARYYTHVRESDPREGRASLGYVDPIAEFGSQAIEYLPEEIEDFERVLESRLRPAPREEPAPRLRTEFFGEEDAGGSSPFFGMSREMRGLLRPRPQVREIVALLGPLASGGGGSLALARDLLRGSGAFPRPVESGDGTDVYALCESPPPPERPLKDENFEPDEDASLEALVQERLRVEVREAPFEYKFQWR